MKPPLIFTAVIALFTRLCRWQRLDHLDVLGSLVASFPNAERLIEDQVYHTL